MVESHLGPERLPGLVCKVQTRNILQNSVVHLSILVDQFMLAAGYPQTRSVAVAARAVPGSVEAKAL